jgi:hypothetical protein
MNVSARTAITVAALLSVCLIALVTAAIHG